MTYNKKSNDYQIRYDEKHKYLKSRLWLFKIIFKCIIINKFYPNSIFYSVICASDQNMKSHLPLISVIFKNYNPHSNILQISLNLAVFENFIRENYIFENFLCHL